MLEKPIRSILFCFFFTQVSKNILTVTNLYNKFCKEKCCFLGVQFSGVCRSVCGFQISLDNTRLTCHDLTNRFTGK